MYTTQSRVEAYLARDLTDEETLLIDDTIVFISQFIDSYTNRSWLSIDGEFPEEEEVRYFDGNGNKELTIGDFASISEIEILDSDGNMFTSYTEDTDWLTFPLNKTTKSDVRLRSYRFPSGRGNIRITGVFGSGTVPQGVQIVATALVGKYLTKQSSSSGKFKSESIEGYSYTLRDDAEQDKDIQRLLSMLDMHKRILL